MSASGISWAIRKSAPRSRQNLRTTPPLIFLQAGCPSCCPTNSIKALKAQHWTVISYNNKHKYDEMKVIRRGSIAPCTNRTNVCRQKQFHLNGVNIKRIHAALKLPAESLCMFTVCLFCNICHHVTGWKNAGHGQRKTVLVQIILFIMPSSQNDQQNISQPMVDRLVKQKN